MKKLLLLIVSIFVCASVVAQEVDIDRLILNYKDGRKVEVKIEDIQDITFTHEDPATPDSLEMNFNVVITGVSALQAEVIITPENDEVYYADVLPKANINDEYIKNLVSDEDFQNKLTSGVDTLSFINATLRPSTEYCVLLVPYDLTNNTIGKANMENCFTTLDEVMTFTCTQNLLTSAKAEYLITPSSNDVNWYSCILDKQKYESEKANYESIFGYDMAWWEFVGSFYGETWQDQIKFDSKKGAQTVSSPEFTRWNTPHVIYYYGIDLEGNLLTDIHVEEFTTAMPTPSENQITATIDKVYPTGVDLTITTTNDDQYFFVFQPKSAVDQVDLSTPEAKDNYVYSLMLQYYSSFRFFGTGDMKLTFENDTYYHFSDAMIDTDMCLIVFGYDGGPTTDIQIINFHTPAE